MRPFWKDGELSAEEMALFSALQVAHHKAAMRPNTSTQVAIETALGSGSYPAAIAAAILTLGNVHGPIEQAMEFLDLPGPMHSEVEDIIQANRMIPGWGSSFPPDPEFDRPWQVVACHIDALNPGLRGDIESVSIQLARHGKPILPNPACWTAAAALTLGVPAKVAPYFFITGRITAWTDLINRLDLTTLHDPRRNP